MGAKLLFALLAVLLERSLGQPGPHEDADPMSLPPEYLQPITYAVIGQQKVRSPERATYDRNMKMRPRTQYLVALELHHNGSIGMPNISRQK